MKMSLDEVEDEDEDEEMKKEDDEEKVEEGNKEWVRGGTVSVDKIQKKYEYKGKETSSQLSRLLTFKE